MKPISYLVTCILGCTLAFTACNRKTDEDKTQVQPKDVMPEQPAETQNEKIYRLQVGDTITMQVFQEPDLTVIATIDKTGEVLFRLIGKVDVKGLSVPEVVQKLEKLYRKDYLPDPKISITTESSRTSNP